MKAQLVKEGIIVTFDQLFANAIFAGNALANVGGGTPDNARPGSQPSMLPDHMAPADGETRLQTNTRIRQVAFEKIISATAVARINRALNSTTTVAGEDLAYEPGELLDHWTTPSTADENGC